MNIKVIVASSRKCPASVDWNKDFTKAVLSFGDLETPDTDVEVEFTMEQLAALGCVGMEAETAGNEGRTRRELGKSKDDPDFYGGTYHGGRC